MVQKITQFDFRHSDQPDEPNLSAYPSSASWKAALDSQGEQLRVQGNAIIDAMNLGNSPISVTAPPYLASGLATTTTGSITTGTALLTVASTTGRAVGQGISIAGAGVTGAILLTKISAINGLVITLATNASATVAAAVVGFDDSINIQTAIDAVNASGGGVVYFPKGTYIVSSQRFRTGVSTDEDGCILARSNVELHFAKGAILKNINGINAWSRTLKISGVQNVKISGFLEINGNASNVVSGNEHMHGLMVYNAQNVEIQSIYSHDCYGDNIFLGGTETLYSDNVKIGYMHCVTAGRKNLVIHFVDKLHINTAILDNSLGGMAFGAVGYNSLDLEPDAFAGTRTFYQRIDYLSTYGLGNDFTVGTTEALARKWILDIGTFDIRRMAKSSTSDVNTIFALTLRIDKLRVEIPDAENAYGFNMQYAANVTVNDAIFSGGSNYLVRGAAVGSDQPKFRCDKLKLYGTSAYGLQSSGAHMRIGLLDAESLFGNVLDVNATIDHSIEIDQIEINNCSSAKIILNLSQTSTFVPYIKFGNISVRDTQGTHASAIMKVWTNLVAAALTVGSINNINSLAIVISYVGTGKYFKLVGGGNVYPAHYICTGTPEAMIAAPIGSIAQRTDGGAATSYYVKESGTGNTGWVAK